MSKSFMEILGTISIIILASTLIFVFFVEFFVYLKNKKDKLDLEKEREESKYKIYEIEILNALNDQVGYSLGAENIMDIIKRSLQDFVDYNVVTWALFYSEKIVLKHFLKDSVSRNFIDEVGKKILDSKNVKTEEVLKGAIVDEESTDSVGSFFSVPLEISGKVVGLLAIADTRKNIYREKEINTLHKIVETASRAVTRLQEVVKSENSKLNAMVASMTDGVVMVDKENRVLVANPVAKKAVGLENKNDLSILDFEKVLSKDFNLTDKIDESFRLENVFISEEITLADKFFKIIVAPVKDSWKKLGCVVIFRDITHEKEVQKIKEEFTAMIVHELRSPLDSIKKMIGLMRASELVKKKRTECYQMIYGSSSDMLELINNLLDIAKIEAGKFELMKQKSDIKKLIGSRVLFFDIAAKDAKVKLATCFGKDIPEDVEFDPHTISQVLNNLLSNAIKFTKENGSVTIQALLHKNGESLQEEAKLEKINWFIKKDFSDVADSLFVAVTDTGIGIPEDQIGKLFNKFVQAKSTFVEKGGTGLGLAITKSIVESHNGIVGADSVQGQGATFYFTLPINTK